MECNKCKYEFSDEYERGKYINKIIECPICGMKYKINYDSFENIVFDDDGSEVGFDFQEWYELEEVEEVE